MVQKIHPKGVILIPSSLLMWADQLKKNSQQFRPYIKKSMPSKTIEPGLSTKGKALNLLPSLSTFLSLLYDIPYQIYLTSL